MDTTAATGFVVTTPTPLSVSTTVDNIPSTFGTVWTPITQSTSATVGTTASSPGTVSAPSIITSVKPSSNFNFGTFSGLLSTSASVTDLTSVPKTVIAATSLAAANLTNSGVPSVISRTIPSTAQESKRDSQSKKMNFSLKLEKLSGKNNEDARSWLIQFAKYSACYGLDAETKANVFSFDLQDHARIWYNALADSVKND